MREGITREGGCDRREGRRERKRMGERGGRRYGG